MQSSLLSHSLVVEFPELSNSIHYLKTHDAHFTKIMNEHDELDKIITQSEEGLKPLADDIMKEYKVKRLHLKQEMHKIALNHK